MIRPRIRPPTRDRPMRWHGAPCHEMAETAFRTSAPHSQARRRAKTVRARIEPFTQRREIGQQPSWMPKIRSAGHMHLLHGSIDDPAIVQLQHPDKYHLNGGGNERPAPREQSSESPLLLPGFSVTCGGASPPPWRRRPLHRAALRGVRKGSGRSLLLPERFVNRLRRRSSSLASQPPYSGVRGKPPHIGSERPSSSLGVS